MLIYPKNRRYEFKLDPCKQCPNRDYYGRVNASTESLDSGVDQCDDRDKKFRCSQRNVCMPDQRVNFLLRKRPWRQLPQTQSV